MPLLSAPTGDSRSWHRREQSRLASSTAFMGRWMRQSLTRRKSRPDLKAATAQSHIASMAGGHQIIEVALGRRAMPGWRLDRALAAALPTLSRERLKALIQAAAR